jgi:hypothetical protein
METSPQCALSGLTARATRLERTRSNDFAERRTMAGELSHTSGESALRRAKSQTLDG